MSCVKTQILHTLLPNHPYETECLHIVHHLLINVLHPQLGLQQSLQNQQGLPARQPDDRLGRA